MGLMSAIDLSEMDLSLDKQLQIHFRNNCYPPVPLIMLDPATKAIHAYWEEEYSKMIDLPFGVTFRGRTQIPASQIVDSLRLEAWVMDDDDQFEEFEEV